MWLTALQKELGGEVSDERMRDYIWNTLKSGRVSTLCARPAIHFRMCSFFLYSKSGHISHSHNPEEKQRFYATSALCLCLVFGTWDQKVFILCDVFK